jgi:hypothetical protein
MEPTEPLEPAGDSDIGQPLATAAMALARRFAGGATLWCIAPQWPEHARHVAVEFVHPVLVGKRALPAISVDGADPVASLRALVRPGDVVLAISLDESPVVAEVMRRADAWGVTTIWMGVGRRPSERATERPDERAADHVVWADDHEAERSSASAAHDGRLVLLYHVLWELTHVCFEHPGLLTTTDQLEACDDDGCITCTDEGRLGEVITTDHDGSARVRTARGIETIDTTIVADVVPGDLVLIHAGTAIAEVP